MKYFLHTKLKLSYLRIVINFATINLFLIIALYLGVRNDIKKFNNLTEASNYVKTHAIPAQEMASEDEEDNFDQLILESGLAINNKKVEYGVFAEKDNAVKASYDLAIYGKYLAFIDYLEILVRRNMLYKMNTLSLKLKSLEGIDIKMNIETLYEIK